VVVASAALVAQQPPPVGIAPVTVAGPYTFDTAEQHRIRVVVVARGLSHPFAVAFLPNGAALVSERSTSLRIVRGATGASPQLDSAPVAGLPDMPAFRQGGLQDVVRGPSRTPASARSRWHAARSTARRSPACRISSSATTAPAPVVRASPSVPTAWST
jgi:glucose/arabinose dehydrogenase